MARYCKSCFRILPYESHWTITSKVEYRRFHIEVSQTFPDVQKVWKCESKLDFLYGYYVGKIEEGALRYLLKATRASAGGYVDTFDIRGVIEMHKDEILKALKKSLEM